MRGPTRDRAPGWHPRGLRQNTPSDLKTTALVKSLESGRTRGGER